MLYPLTFQPIFKERVWGGRNLERLYRKPLPPGVPIGESWEITDRPEGVSIIANGPLAGKNLRWVMEHHAEELLGQVKPQNGRFPLLVKILDAQETLSLQVHPPADKAAQLGGEPKTELWYVADAAPDAEIFVGLKRGVLRAEFERKIRDGTVAECVHRQRVKRGDAMFLPSGRLHSLGAGNVIFEIQQNSDTTYRVFDWNRVGLDGQPRELHVEPALQSIDFEDVEPSLIDHGQPVRSDPYEVQELVADTCFSATLYRGCAAGKIGFRTNRLQVIGVVAGSLSLEGVSTKLSLRAGQFCVIPASAREFALQTSDGAAFLSAG